MPNKKFLLAVSVFFLVLLTGAIVLIVHVGNNTDGGTSVSQSDDSGVAVCKVMAAPAEHPKLDDEWLKERLTAFGNSRFEDLRTAGTDVTNAAYRLENEMANAKSVEELDQMTGDLQTAKVALRQACENHGVSMTSLV